MEVIYTLVGTFLGAYLAFAFNNWKENKNELNKEKAMLYEALDIIKQQALYLEHIESIFNINYADNIIPSFITKDSVNIKSNVRESDLDWLKYGRLMQLFSVQEINFEKIIFLVNRRRNGGYTLLKKIRSTVFGNQQIKNLIQMREEYYEDLDIFYSGHSIQDIFQNITNKNKLNDILIYGHQVTTKLMVDIGKCKDELNDCGNSIEEYINSEYIDECCFKKYCGCGK